MASKLKAKPGKAARAGRKKRKRAPPPQPKWQTASALKRGRAALKLGKEFRPRLEERLEAGCIDGLETDLITFGQAPTDRVDLGIAQKAGTATERDVAADAADWVVRVRDLVKKTRGMKKADRKAFGVGEKVHKDVTTKVRGAVLACIRAADAKPERAHKIGLIEKDLVEGRGLAALLPAADAAQMTAIDTKTDATRAKGDAHLRIEAAVDQIASRGAFEFRRDSAILARFDALTSNAGPSAEDVEPEPEPT